MLIESNANDSASSTQGRWKMGIRNLFPWDGETEARMQMLHQLTTTPGSPGGHSEEVDGGTSSTKQVPFCSPGCVGHHKSSSLPSQPLLQPILLMVAQEEPMGLIQTPNGITPSLGYRYHRSSQPQVHGSYGKRGVGIATGEKTMRAMERT